MAGRRGQWLRAVAACLAVACLDGRASATLPCALHSLPRTQPDSACTLCAHVPTFRLPCLPPVQMLFGSGADIVPSDEPVRVRLPALTATDGEDGGSAAARQDAAADELPAMLRQTRGAAAAARRAAGGSDELGEGESEEEERPQDVRQQQAADADSSDATSDEEAAAEEVAAAARRRQQRRRQAAAAPELDPVAAAAAAAYAARDAAGAPQPLEPELVTLSMLPRTQWQNLVHLDTIKVGAGGDCWVLLRAAVGMQLRACGACQGAGGTARWCVYLPAGRPACLPLPVSVFPTPHPPSPCPQARNKPIEPPKKPEAAPFFLPTLAGVDAGRNPVFDFGAAAAGGEEGGAGGGTPAAAADPAAEAALAARAAAAGGDGEEEEEEGGDGGSEAEREQGGAADAAGSGAQRRRPPVGRVLKTRAAAEHSQLVRLLHACVHAGDWASLVAFLRGLPPVQVDAEIRAMQVGGCWAGKHGPAAAAAVLVRCANGPGHRPSPRAHLPSPPLLSPTLPLLPRCWRAPPKASWRTWACCCSSWRRRRQPTATLSLCRWVLLCGCCPVVCSLAPPLPRPVGWQPGGASRPAKCSQGCGASGGACRRFAQSHAHWPASWLPSHQHPAPPCPPCAGGAARDAAGARRDDWGAR